MHRGIHHQLPIPGRRANQVGERRPVNSELEQAGLGYAAVDLIGNPQDTGRFISSYVAPTPFWLSAGSHCTYAPVLLLLSRPCGEFLWLLGNSIIIGSGLVARPNATFAPGEKWESLGLRWSVRGCCGQAMCFRLFNCLTAVALEVSTEAHPSSSDVVSLESRQLEFEWVTPACE